MGMRRLGDQTRRATDALLATSEAKVLKTTSVDLESLRSRVDDSDTYTKLIDTIKEATNNNANIAQLQARIQHLGPDSVALAKKLVQVLYEV